MRGRSYAAATAISREPPVPGSDLSVLLNKYSFVSLFNIRFKPASKGSGIYYLLTVLPLIDGRSRCGEMDVQVPVQSFQSFLFMLSQGWLGSGTRDADRMWVKPHCVTGSQFPHEDKDMQGCLAI